MEAELHSLKIDKHQRARRDERSTWPWAVAAVLLLILAAGAAWTWRKSSTTPPVQTVRARVAESSARTNDLVLLNATGYIMAAHKIELASKVVGRVAWVGVEMGDKIAKGQVLVRLEDDEYKARVMQAQGQLDAAQARLAELEAGSRPEEVAQAKAALDQAAAELAGAEVNFRRLKDLEGTKSVAQQQIDDAEWLVNSRRAQASARRQSWEMARIGPRKEQIDAQRAVVRQLEGVLAMARIDLDNTVIRSPIAATVLERNVEVGEFVTTGFVGDRGAKGYVVSIADLNDLRVELDISQGDFAKVSAEQPCWIVTDAYPDRKYNGVVDLISPEANRQKATVLVRVKVLEPDRFLKPDMNATVSFLAPASGDGNGDSAASGPMAASQAAAAAVVRIPSSAVRDGAVFVVEDGRAMKRAVTLGNRTASGEVEIRKGLIGGEDVIVTPSDSLSDGDRVSVRQAQ